MILYEIVYRYCIGKCPFRVCQVTGFGTVRMNDGSAEFTSVFYFAKYRLYRNLVILRYHMNALIKYWI